jgi:hypothetical protein
MDLSTLQQVLAPLSKVGKDEHTFEIEGVSVTLRPLLPHEDVGVQRYAVEILREEEEEKSIQVDDEDPGMDRATALDYFDRFRIEVLSHAICQIGAHNLRGVEHVSTGEVVNGIPVKIPRHVAIRNLIRDGWSRTMITVGFNQYGNLVEKLARLSDKLATQSMTDLDAELERLEKRLEDLRAERKRRLEGDPSITKDQIADLVVAGNAQEERVRDITAENDRRRAEANQEVGSFGDVPPPQPPPERPIQQAPPAPPTHQSAPAERVPLTERALPTPEPVVSEADRIAEARRQAREEQLRRLNEGSSDLLSGANPIGQVGGIDAYRLPSETITPRGREESPKAETRTVVDPAAKGSLNPHFKR